jgi:hypothetical protein
LPYARLKKKKDDSKKDGLYNPGMKPEKHTPTEESYSEWQFAYDFFNNQLCISSGGLRLKQPPRD